MQAIAGKLCDAESVVALKDLFNKMNAGNTVAEGMGGVGADSRSSYLFNSNIVGVEDADLVLLLGSDPRIEAPVLNARLRRANVAGGTHVASVGPHSDLTFPVESIGDSARVIEELASGKHPFVEKLKAAERPLIIVGASLLRRPDRDGLMKQIHAVCDATGVVAGDWNGFNVLHDSGGTVAALDLIFVAPERRRWMISPTSRNFRSRSPKLFEDVTLVSILPCDGWLNCYEGIYFY